MAEAPTKSKAVIVTTEVPVQTGGIGTFIWNFAKLLRAHGQDVLVILANPTPFDRKVWAKPFDELGIETAYVFTNEFRVPDGYSWHKRVSEVVAGMIPDDADVVYLADWQAKGFDYVRRLRFSRTPGPAIVTVLHGSTRWLREGMRTVAQSDDELFLDYAESYTAQHSDYVVSPGEYMLSWARGAGWKVPNGDFSRVINYPFLPQHLQHGHVDAAPMVATPVQARMNPQLAPVGALAAQTSMNVQTTSATVAAAAQNGHVPTPARFHRIVFFGRIETRKGIELFVNGLSKLKDQPCMSTINEVILLGGPSVNPYGTPADAAVKLGRHLGAKVKVQSISTLNTFQAQQFLAERAADTLVVVPSVRENFPLSVIETSLIPGLNILASNAGSIGEILGPQGQNHLFEPFLAPFTRKLEQTLMAGPLGDAELGHYQWERANEAWLDFHQEAVNFARNRKSEAVQTMALSRTVDAPEVDRSVDVCVSFYNLGEYLPYLLKSLERQTVQDFNVIVVDDGSTDPKSVRSFEEQAARYASNPSWKFVTTQNGGLSSARNAGADAGSGRYLIFIDADDVVAPNMVERFRDAIEISGDDCLSCYMHLFRGEGWNNAYAHSPIYSYTPTGPDPVLGLISNTFGGACLIVRRDVFNAVSGFSTDVSRYVGFEDYEFYLRLMLDGFNLDVVPDYLLYYRVRDEGMFRTGDLHENQARILRTYERKLQGHGFPGLASLAAGLYKQRSEQQINRSDIDANYLVFQVSGHVLWKALRIKLRNQITKRFARPPRGM